MTNTGDDDKSTSKKNGTQKAESALISVSSGLAAVLIQRTLDKGNQIPVPSLEITLKKDKPKSDDSK